MSLDLKDSPFQRYWPVEKVTNKERRHANEMKENLNLLLTLAVKLFLILFPFLNLISNNI